MAWTPEEPVRGAVADPAVLALSGADRIRLGVRGEGPPPPIHHLLGLAPLSASPASVSFAMPASPWLQSAAGLFFAGTAALVADAPLAGAVLATLGPGEYVMTSDLSMSFLRPTDVSSQRLVSRGRPIEVGRTLGLAEGVVEDGQGRLVAHCTTRCFIARVDVADLPTAPPAAPAPAASYASPDPYLRPVPPTAVDREAWRDVAFLELLERWGDEHAPAPFAQLFAMSDVRGEPGRFRTRMTASPWFCSPAGTIYGGILAYAADTVLTGAVSTTLSTTETAAPLDLKVQFLRPAWPDGRPLQLEAEVTHRGRTLAAAHGRITNADGKVVALATSSAAIRSGGGWASFVVADEAVGP